MRTREALAWALVGIGVVITGIESKIIPVPSLLVHIPKVKMVYHLDWLDFVALISFACGVYSFTLLGMAVRHQKSGLIGLILILLAICLYFGKAFVLGLLPAP